MDKLFYQLLVVIWPVCYKENVIGGYKRTLQWGVTFAVLTLFTFYAVGNISGYGRRVALAKTIEQNQDLLDDGGALVLAAEDRRELRQQQEEERALRAASREERRFQRFLDRFERYYNRQVICVLTDAQKQAVELLYDTSIETLALGDTRVDVLTAEGERLRASVLRNLIRSSGGDLRCRVIKHQNIFYMLFSGSVS